MPASPTPLRVSKRQSWYPTWADASLDDLQDAEDSLDDEAESLEESVEQLTGAARAIGSVLSTGVETIAEVVRLDPVLAASLDGASTCEQLREETGT